eukprot:4875198-Pleurochrysis_carterae.AAC.3
MGNCRFSRPTSDTGTSRALEKFKYKHEWQMAEARLGNEERERDEASGGVSRKQTGESFLKPSELRGSCTWRPYLRRPPRGSQPPTTPRTECAAAPGSPRQPAPNEQTRASERVKRAARAEQRSASSYTSCISLLKARRVLSIQRLTPSARLGDAVVVRPSELLGKASKLGGLRAREAPRAPFQAHVAKLVEGRPVLGLARLRTPRAKRRSFESKACTALKHGRRDSERGSQRTERFAPAADRLKRSRLDST